MDTCTLGAKPTLSEVRDYYLRTDILAEISRLTHLRDVELIHRTAEGEEVHIELRPQTVEQLHSVFGRTFDPRTKLAEGYYPWLHCWSGRAYDVDPHTGQRRLIGSDSGRELDWEWKRSFAELQAGMAVLDELGIYYRVKFSGHRSLHLCIPAEALPERFRHGPEGGCGAWRSAVNAVGAFVRRCGCGDALWPRMAGEEPFSGVYSVHRHTGLVGVPLLPSECRRFRPWMATVHLAAPVPTWWDVPAVAQENFERALLRIRAPAVVVDMGAARAAAGRTCTRSGYVASAAARARQAAAAYTHKENLAALRTGGPGVRRRAAWCSMVSGRRLPDEALRLALQDEDDDVRWFALEALCRAGAAGVSAAELLRTVQRLAADPNRYVRGAAVDVLMNSGEDGLVLLLESAGRKRQWKKDGRGPARRRREIQEVWTVHQYVEEGGDAAAEQVARLAHRGGVEVCRAACAVLARCGAAGIRTLMKLLGHTGGDARLEVLAALIYSGEAAAPVLAGAIRQTQGQARELARRVMDARGRLRRGEALCWTMRPATLATVVALGPEAGVEVLGRNLHSANRRESYHASRGLVYVGPASVPVLLDALRSREPLVRRRACEALRDLAAPESRSGLQAALADTDVNVRVSAVRALARIGHPEDREVLAACAADASRAVRRAVRQALAR